METNIIVNLPPPIPYLAKFWFSSYGPKCCQPIKLQDSLKYYISRKKWIMKFIFDMHISIEVFYKLIVSFWVCVTRHAQSTQNKNFAYLWNISRKVWGMKLIFCLQIKTKVFYKLLVSRWVCVARHAQSTQNNTFTIPLQYLKENVKDEVLLPADKRHRFLQIITIILGVCGQACPNYPK